jgi:hypothetical protein
VGVSGRKREGEGWLIWPMYFTYRCEAGTLKPVEIIFGREERDEWG